MASIPFCSFGGYRRWCSAWWNDLAWYLTGISWWKHWRELERPWWHAIRWRQPGWIADILSYWHRARYGWAPRDTWSLDTYLNDVLAGTLNHLADHKSGSPCGYPFTDTCPTDADGQPVTDHDRWLSDLKRWAHAFSEDPGDVHIYDAEDGYVRHRAEEDRRRSNLHAALKELEPWWEALWD